MPQVLMIFALNNRATRQWTRLGHYTVLMVIGFLLTAASAQAAQSVWTVTSATKRLVARLGPSNGQLRIARFHQWTIKLSDQSGNTINDAKIQVSGGMPAHGHGLPTQPTIRMGGSPGRYTIDGMKFNMMGDWLLKLDIESAHGSDTIDLTFSIEAD